MSHDNFEVELKFRTTPTEFKRIRSSSLIPPSNRWVKEALRAIYFDTKDLLLHRNGLTLRTRTRGEKRNTICLMAPARGRRALFRRKEIEAATSDLEPKLDALGKAAASELKNILGNDQLEPLLETKFERNRTLLNWHGSAIEVATDEGRIQAGTKTLPLNEVELELKSGNEHDLLDLGLELSRQFSLNVEFVGKGKKGFYLLRGDGQLPVKAQPLKLKRSASPRDCMMLAVESALGQILANWPSEQAFGTPERLHQLRVGLRRMTGTLAVFARVLPSLQLKELRTDFKNFARSTGRMRDVDSLIETIGRSAAPVTVGHKRLLDHLMGARAACETDWPAERSAQATQSVIRTQMMLRTVNLEQNLAAKERTEFDRPAREFIEKTMDRLHHKTLKLARPTGKRPADWLHEVRIAAKNLRYACEMFGSVLGKPRKQREYIKAISRLQDVLGRSNDRSVAKSILGGFDFQNAPEPKTESARLLQAVFGDVPKNQREAAKALNDFQEAQPFWM